MQHPGPRASDDDSHEIKIKSSVKTSWDDAHRTHLHDTAGNYSSYRAVQNEIIYFIFLAIATEKESVKPCIKGQRSIKYHRKKPFHYKIITKDSITA